MKFTDELYACVAPHMVLSDLLGVRVKRSGETSVRCVRPESHARGDRAKSASANGTTGLYCCHGCGLSGDVVDVAQQVHGLSTQADAIAWLRQRHGVPAGRSRGQDAASSGDEAPRTSSDGFTANDGGSGDFPPYPDVARSIGWTILEAPNGPIIRAPIFDAALEQCGVKVRGARGADGRIHAFLETGPDGRRMAGLLNAGCLETADEGRLVLVVNGETSLLCALDCARREGIEVLIVCPSNGETQSLVTAAAAFRSLRVVLLYDSDDVGRKGASERAEEIATHAEAVVDLALPFTPQQAAGGCKDVRDWLTRCGGSVRELVRLAEAKFPRVRTATRLLADLREGRLRKRTVYVEGLLRARDILALFGPPGMGKTQLGIALLVALAVGSEHVPHVLPDDTSPQWRVVADRPLRVLLVSAEDDDSDTAERLAALLRARGLPEHVENLVIFTPSGEERNLASAAGRALLERLVRLHRPDIVAIDNLTTVLPGLDKSKEEIANQWIESGPRRLRDLFGVTVLLYGHANKSSAKDDARSALERLFGSMAWGACADGAVSIDVPTERPGMRRIVHAKHRGFAPFPSITVEAARGDCVFPVVEVEVPPSGKAQFQGKVGPDEIVDALKARAAKGEREVSKEELRAQVNAARSDRGVENEVGKTAWETALRTLSKVRGARFGYHEGTGRGDPWKIYLLPPSASSERHS